MLPVTVSTAVVFLHVVAATVWVGGQITLAALVPVLRDTSREATRRVAVRFARIAWPAYAVLIGTGVWRIAELGPAWDSAYGRTLLAKIGVAAASGAAAFLHGRSSSPAALAAFGAISGLTALGAVFLGVQVG